MISIVLYGRNDNYGYNLHKRAALSLNCMAEVLSHEGDEILFVDYNTRDDYPTFPEAISDTLTEKARSMIRVLRVRPDVHERLYSGRTHLVAIEPISRNVAVRRSNPANRWILSTNTDMIFVPREGRSLSDDVAGLTEGFYCAPRMEIPETLWENFDRKDPAGVIEDVRSLGEQLHLNEIVLGSDEILYDGPGDFQLMRRDDLFRIDGFHEDMILGWHVDSNISKRLMLIHGTVSDAAPIVFGYHCDHTRQVTAAHAHKSPVNDPDHFVTNVRVPDLPEQRGTWGLSGGDVEEINLLDTASQRYRETLARVIETPLDAPLVAAYRSDNYNTAPAPAGHVLPFLVDIFASSRRNTRVAWLGAQDTMLAMFQRCWSDLGFETPVEVISDPPAQIGAISRADTLIINFGIPETCTGKAEVAAAKAYRAMILNERDHLVQGRQPRRIIAVNAIHNRFENLVLTHLSCAKTPFSARLRHGYLIPATLESPTEWIDEMHAGAAGQRVGKGIESNGATGHVIFGPYKCLPSGTYEFRVQVSVRTARGKGFLASLRQGNNARFAIEIVVDEQIRSQREIDLGSGNHVVRTSTDIAETDSMKPVQVRLCSLDGCSVRIDSVLVDEVLASPIA